ncbi:dTDP-4-amino-4,6-dideoxygalactose transaminase [Hespellia stercorisuis]|uniref:dTDP-4-amino-4,6-dideoxygalactose transaminase n=1 Tax=Hespellia stercorisuis DSM 15480 TaxID=1121950 RepID=A0A1M6V245_9FIRM|nr:dTDP-4-amino-4,6-dideoxygalactose transaminase [Hespellia stercorisuis]SHK75577.1 dTDP-4-amino-4,6-dideoxygalactose transaminase [Hespellia stercorisuis DSM 15480]
MIGFNVPAFTGKELDYIKESVMQHHICGDGVYTKKCSRWMEAHFDAQRVMLTTSCTHALEMAAILSDIKQGDEVIMPAYTFVSSADAFVMRGARIVFVDIHPETMNIDERLIEDAITERTKVIVPVHYAGVACEMDEIMAIAKRHHLLVIEDAAQGVNAFYKGRALGTIGDFGCYSFHETKNYTMGEGGAIVIRDPACNEQAEVIREKGTNRSKFFRGQIDKYTWVDAGSSYLPSDMNAAYLWAQLELAEEINDNRRATFDRYQQGLSDLAGEGKIEQPFCPDYAVHNAHMYYIKTKDVEERTALITSLNQQEVQGVFHYIPLHTAPAGQKFGRFHGEDRYTTRESERLLRLPMYYGLTEIESEHVIEAIQNFYRKER